jgi:hypothetical protein
MRLRLRARVVASAVLVCGAVACSALTGAGDYAVRDCQGCLVTLCASEVDTCNADRGCSVVLMCIEQYCPNMPDEPSCLMLCMSRASSTGTGETQDDITGLRSCGFKNCVSCAAAAAALPSDAAPMESASGG